jgi:uncharacterized protein (TIGR02145 family)
MNFNSVKYLLLVFLPVLLSCSKKADNTVTIGAQVWANKNLDVETYRNGDPIPHVQDSAEWSVLNTGAWCYYEDTVDDGRVYEKLYNWHAVNDPRGLAPEGWRIPENEDWTILINNLGGPLVAGGKLKAPELWEGPNKGAKNEKGFSALPAGGRRGSGIFAGYGTYAAFWTSNPVPGRNDYAWGWAIDANKESIGHIAFYKGAAFSVRLMKE